MSGPLGRWLRRSPLEPLPSSSFERDQQTAEGPSSSPEEQQRQKGTLHSFLIKREAGAPSQEPDGVGNAPARRQAKQGARSVMDWRLTGSLNSSAAALLHHRHTAAFHQLAIFQSHAFRTPVLGGIQLSPEEAGSIQAAAFDSLGELLVAGSEEGLLTVHNTAQLLTDASCCTDTAALPPGQQAVGTADPLVVLDTHLPKLQAVRWNPADENVVGVVSSATRQLHLYDLQHTQGLPKQVLAVPQQAASAVGLTDLAFFGGSSSNDGSGNSGSSSGSGYVVLASGMGGQVFLWDARAKAAPCATLQAAQCGALYAVQLAPDGQVALAGTQSGEVKLWDLRGGSTSTLRFGGTVHHHPLLAAVNVRHALTAVPGLASQTAIPASAIHSMQLDPTDQRRLGFHLGCGWSGVLSLQGAISSGTSNSSMSSGNGSIITHLHAPAHAHADQPLGSQEGPAAVTATVAQMLLWASTAAPGLHRHACWTHDGRRYCVPSRRSDTLMLLDFAASSAAGCYVLREEELEEAGEYVNGSSTGGNGSGSNGRQSRVGQQAPPAVEVPLSQAAVCAAAHPSFDLLVAGSMNSCLSLAGLT